MKLHSLLLSIALSFLTASCISNREVLEGQLNWNIGKPFANAWPHVPAEKMLKETDGITQYKVRLNENCFIFFLVDARGTTTGWEYGSDPSFCHIDIILTP